MENIPPAKPAHIMRAKIRLASLGHNLSTVMDEASGVLRWGTAGAETGGGMVARHGMPRQAPNRPACLRQLASRQGYCPPILQESPMAISALPTAPRQACGQSGHR